MLTRTSEAITPEKQKSSPRTRGACGGRRGLICRDPTGRAVWLVPEAPSNVVRVELEGRGGRAD